MSDEDDRRRWFANTLTNGARELREVVGLDDHVGRAVRPRQAAEARAAYVVAAIDDVTKAAVMMIQVDDALKDFPTTPADRSTRLVGEALSDELSLQQRKLTEALITSVAFRLTNSEPHYRCYLLLAQLDQHLIMLRDLEEFDGCSPAFIVATVESIRNEIVEHERRHPEVANAWYRGSQGLHAAVLAGVASRYRYAITAASAAEQLALGETYGQAYGEMSAALHFAPLSWGRETNSAALRRAHASSGVLGQRVLLVVQDITGAVAPADGAIAQLRRLDDTNEYPEQLLASVTAGRASVDDEVIAHGYPGVVEEIKTNQYLRESYRVRFTSEERPPGARDDDWFPSYWIETPASAATRTDDGPRRPAPTPGASP